MSGEIINRVANSKLITLDLEDYYPSGDRVVLDISTWLFQGFILKEKDFRESVDQHDWSQYQDKYVAIICSTDAIIPSWAYLLISTSLSPYAAKFVIGDLELLENAIFQDIIANISLDPFKDAPVIIKGCSDKNIPDSAYAYLTQRLVSVVRSLMFGEACSSVPLYKKKK
ncbi:DUF2480 family protein [Lutimonas sp.]|uniref:DUF2480 family protein n=1 Tax=Lutimonas sp. TaxID=1872403 RepID=UPI003D9AF9A6